MTLCRKLTRLLRIYILFWYISLYIWFANRKFSGWVGIARAAFFTKKWAQASAGLINLKLEVRGEKGKFPGGLIICNHQGYLDILVCASLFSIRFAPKMEIRRWPFLGKMIGLNRPVWVDRSSPLKSQNTARLLVETMRHHVSMLVYPEGKSSDGSGLLPFKSTPFEAAVEGQLPILPMLIRYSSLPEDGDGGPLAWYGSDPLLPHIWRILGLKSITATVHILPEVRPLPNENRKMLAARIHEMMVAEYEEF